MRRTQCMHYASRRTNVNSVAYHRRTHRCAAAIVNDLRVQFSICIGIADTRGICTTNAPNPIYFISVCLILSGFVEEQSNTKWNECRIRARFFNVLTSVCDEVPLASIWFHSAIFFSCLHRANYMRQRSTHILHEMTRKHQQSSSSHARTHRHTHTHHSIVFVFALYRCKIANCIMQKQNTYQN